MPSGSDPRRHIPRTDALLQHPALVPWLDSVDAVRVRGEIRRAQDRARRGECAPEEVAAEVARSLRHVAEHPSGWRPVINATGVVVHTNLGRAALSEAAQRALVDAAGPVPVEMDMRRGVRSRQRGAEAREALLDACPAAEDALVVNNGAAALLLSTAALAGPGAELIISRGELIEIGAGFRLPELIESTGVRLKEVGSTNRTHARDYEEAIGPKAGAILKVHPSNYRVEGFHTEVGVGELARIAHGRGLPLIMDAGSGLLRPDPLLPGEPDAESVLRAGADIVLASGDKLLGGPQAGIVLGRAEAIRRMARHPLARAVRTNKSTLAALHATLTAPAADVPVYASLHADPEELRSRCERLAASLSGQLREGDPAAGGEVGVEVCEHDGRVGGGGAPGVPLPGWALRLPEWAAAPLRAGTPPVLGRVHQGACLLDLRCVPPAQDAEVLRAVRAVLAGRGRGTGATNPEKGEKEDPSCPS
ncbi:L-seryl-tRNA(Sec) selenium transferase [Corynebacterium uropygiale]|uniref:L-seryl-tRNA(Sec) selenium transferase n=1 Tax=Corynebacterium uropygiale TaxID=1775911 RepID=A0A9X1QTR7_9CORY|nr:L-seryl-tRNA(Sec) selenium transferase [Corynebacterium uropygiale]MCF4006870.1 L-seryl-tRNA(Sec) selenium transferase [Corynebacterium uropygiale]